MNEPVEVSKLRSMVQDRVLTKELLATTQFNELLGTLSDHANCSNQSIKTITLSVLARAASVSKPVKIKLQPIILKSLSTPITDSIEIGDGDDRYYFAKALSFTTKTWIYDYAISQIVEEEISEKARAEWVEMSVRNTKSLEALLSDINNRLRKILPKLKLDSDSTARRLLRICTSLEQYLATEDMPVGDNFGKQLYKLYISHNSRSGPDDRILRLRFAEAQIKSLIKILRLNVLANSDPQVYKTIGGIISWWDPATPPQELSPLITRVAEIGTKTLHIYARQGVKRSMLRKTLADACGNSVLNRITKKVADDDPSLGSEVAYWLATGKNLPKTNSNSIVKHHSLVAFDEQFSHLMIALASSKLDQNDIKLAVEGISSVFPEESQTIEVASNQISIIKQWVRSLARSRRLELFGKLSERVKFDPALHECSSDLIVNSEVKVIQPGVVKKSEGRPKSIIVKMLVEELDE